MVKNLDILVRFNGNIIIDEDIDLDDLFVKFALPPIVHLTKGSSIKTFILYSNSYETILVEETNDETSIT